VPPRKRTLLRETADKISGDKALQTDGKIDKAKGDVHNAVGNIKDAARELKK
jgi:uncharacterized protein YjbJ (UPF0337 family)